ncbi:MAG TPA: hypothetical protein VF950_24345 [Planctomycetota bacterium]
MLTLLVLLGGCSGPGSRLEPSGLDVGAAEVNITPPRPMRLAGTFQERISTGTKDPLKAKALVFAQGESRAALVFCDLIGVPVGVSYRARQRAAQATGIPAAHIAIAATRGPAGPLYYGAVHKILHERAMTAAGVDPLDFDYAGFLVGRIAEAVEKAARARRPARLEASAGQLLARDASGPYASLTVLNRRQEPAGTRFSAGFAGAIEAALREGLRPELISCVGSGPSDDAFAAEDVGDKLAASALAAAPRLDPAGPAGLAVANERVDLLLQRYPLEQVDHARQNAGKIGTKELPTADQARICSILHLQEMPAVLPLEVQVFRFSADLALVTLPGDVFAELGQSIQRSSPFRRTLVVQLANDHPGAIPPRDAFAAGRGRVAHARIEAGGGEKLVEAALRLLGELKP